MYSSINHDNAVTREKKEGGGYGNAIRDIK